MLASRNIVTTPIFSCLDQPLQYIFYEMYRLPTIQLTLMEINLRMRFEQIAFVRKRIVPQG